MRITLILTSLAAAALLAACGESGDGDNAAAKADPEQAMLKFAQCMREHGVDMPDPKPAAGGGPTRVELGARAGDDQGKLDEAHKACEKYMRAAAPEISPEQREKMREGGLKFARCMRSNGIDMPDPTFNEDGGVLIRVGGPGQKDPARNPRFRAAQKECSRLLPGLDGEERSAPPPPDAP